MATRRWAGENGVEIETTILKGREAFRLSKDGYFIAYCATMDDVARIVSLDSLVEIVDLTAPDEEDGSGESGEEPGDAK
ncbi:hypothetical protein [Spongiactinospora sp. TRM90649]|uniref:hypothetical protein n=1 Tax=Spongiactinospora sp. TRM90649 TaxID=3031114 RepID=UPI0023F965F2|nr:hypothetical protein [Spongiactinospora sp. TRM90649]MDF5758193.1 hypothetical protein [Spongiactinospora sp. TRM90649]